MNDHLWQLKFHRVLCPRTEKHLPLRKAKEAQVTVTDRRADRDNNVLFNKL